MRLFFVGILVMSLLFTNSSRGQEILPVYSDYLTDNLYLLHPSMAGASNMNKIRLTARQQWFDVDNAPALQTLNVHGRKGENVGLGGIVFNDQNGNFSKRGIFGTFAYHLMFSRSEFDLNQLSFGISAGFVQHSLDQSGFTGNDPLIGNGRVSDLYGNMDVGLSYYYYNFFTHLTAKNILAIDRELYFTDGIHDNQRQYIFSTGYVIETRRRYWSFEPSILFQWKEASAEKMIDANFKVYRDMEFGSLFGGISYRRSLEGIEYSNGEESTIENLQYVTPFAGVEFGKFLFAYTYSQQFNTVVMSNNGFHQITLGYNFGENRGRYECYCPGVNQSRRR